MKRTLINLIAFVLILAMTSCGNSNNQTPSVPRSENSSPPESIPTSPSVATYITPSVSPSAVLSPSPSSNEAFTDEDLSSFLSKDIGDNFNTTTWYPCISSIEVRNNGNDVYYAVVTVSTESEDTASRIGNAVFANSNDIVELNYIMVMNADGNILFERNKL